jgi:hypothetical protein
LVYYLTIFNPKDNDNFLIYKILRIFVIDYKLSIYATIKKSKCRMAEIVSESG